MLLAPGSTFQHPFIVRDGSRKPVDADSLPDATLVRNGIDTSIPVTVVSTARVGEYRATATIPETWDVGDAIHLRIMAVYDNIALRAVVDFGILVDESEILGEDAGENGGTGGFIDTNLAPFQLLDLYTTDQHLAVEDAELFYHNDRTKQSLIERATHDVKRDLRAKGINPDCLLDRRSRATIELQITATADGPVTLLATQHVVEDTSNEYGRRGYRLVDDLTLLAGETGTVDAQADDFGRPFNLAIEDCLVLDPSGTQPNIASIQTRAVCVVADDHILTLATTYRALELVYMDYMREEDDCWDVKRRLYHKMYKEEISRTLAAGLEFDEDGDGQSDYNGRRFVLRRMGRG